jgi:hypothetical protein
MTKLYVQEYDGLGRTEQSDSVAVPSIDAATVDQVVDYTAGAASSLPFAATTRWVYVVADSICSIKFSPSSAPVLATVNNFRLAAGVPMLFRVPNVIPQPQLGQSPTSQSWQVSAITNT